MNNMNIKDYWNPSSPSYPKVRFVNKPASPDDWDIDEDEAEYEDEDPYCDEIGHYPDSIRYKHTSCIYCATRLTRMHSNGKTVWVDPDELVKLKKWNEMTGKSGGEA